MMAADMMNVMERILKGLELIYFSFELNFCVFDASKREIMCKKNNITRKL